MKDLLAAHYILGVELICTSSILSLTQTKYVVDLLKCANMHEVKPMPTPASSGRRLSISNGDLLSDPTECRSIVGALQYLTLTHPDIAFAVNQVCQFMHQHITIHCLAVKRILHYLNDTFTHGLLYSPSNLYLNVDSDADYVGCLDDRRSIGGYCVYFDTNLISWSSKKQRSVSRHSTEFEYCQLAYTAATLSWLHALFLDLHLPVPCPKLWSIGLVIYQIVVTPLDRLRRSTILSALGPLLCPHGFVSGNSRATSQWVTHPGIALAPNSLNFGVPKTPKPVSSQKASCWMDAGVHI
ncbi:hypothetical protein L3X38_024286 [Prunus dulcis]|uniref:Transposable element protein n=1 Tax=Prunus dulcis TaxID=3755 RepID=A0AAD4W0L8_PRUDU|nr:hypothetical protein L3X38_024286 [Prunus dulcis]